MHMFVHVHIYLYILIANCLPSNIDDPFEFQAEK